MDSATLMRADLWTYLSENCLGKTDRASMAHGLEVRVPMLGQPVLDVALTLPDSVLLAGGLKSLLVDLARRDLPRQVWDRPKHGFSVPLTDLFASSWRSVGDDVFSRIHTLAPFLEANQVQALWADAKVKKGSRRLAYTFLVLLLWLEEKGLSCAE